VQVAVNDCPGIKTPRAGLVAFAGAGSALLMRDAFVLGAPCLFFSNKNPAKNRRVAMYYLVAMSY
jgi:hypothetical protein